MEKRKDRRRNKGYIEIRKDYYNITEGYKWKFSIKNIHSKVKRVFPSFMYMYAKTNVIFKMP